MALRKLPESSNLSQPRKELYRELVVGSTSDTLVVRLDWSLGEIRSQLNWGLGSSFLNNSEFSLTWRLARNALPLNIWAFRACLADMSDCPRCGSGLWETALHAFYYFARSGVTLGSGRPASVPSNSCCSTLVTSWTILILRIKLRSVWCFSQS